MPPEAGQQTQDYDRHPDFDELDARMARVIAAENAQNYRVMKHVMVPLIVAKVVLGGAYYYLESQQEPPREPTYSCSDFTPDVLKPPAAGRFGFSQPGEPLDSRTVSTEGMKPLASGLHFPDGRPVLERPAGAFGNRNGTLQGENVSIPPEYVGAIADVTQHDKTRWGICQFGGGLILRATNATGHGNGEYHADKDTGELVIAAGVEDRLFHDARDVAYTVEHESGHDVRATILKNGTDAESIRLIKEHDALVAEHLKLALEEYRQQHGAEMIADLDTLNSQIQGLGPAKTTKETKRVIQLAIDHLKDKIQQPGGLDELAVYHSDDPDTPESNEVGWMGLDGMIGAASKATVGEEKMIYGISEFAEDYPEVDGKILKKNEASMSKFLEERFISEHLLPGSTGGHGYDNSNETFASEWVVTGLVGPDGHEKFVAEVPPPYQGLTRRQLDIVRQLRESVDPDTLVSAPVPR